VDFAIQELEASDAQISERQLVIFRLADEAFGIDIAVVQEIIRMAVITPVPGARPEILGLVNLRGQTIPVMDLRTRLSMAAGEETSDRRIVVIESAQGRLGLVVDAVEEVVTLQADSWQAPPKLAQSKGADCVESIAKMQDRLITLINLDVLAA
jgi:purine-binding chemotaxis protein CheW